MPINVNDGGVLRTLGEISANDGGVLKKLGTVHANDGGVLRQMFSAGTPIINYGVGSVVRILENGNSVNYIIVHKGLPSSDYDSSCNGIWLLRQRAHSAMAFDTTGDYGRATFSNSAIRTWLNGTFLNTIDATVRGAIKTVKIPNNALTSTISLRVFLLSAYEVGATTDPDDDNVWHYVPKDGAKLSYFSSIGGSGNHYDSIRVAKNGSGSAVPWWLRSKVNNGWNQGAWRINEIGQPLSNYANIASNYARPVFILSNTAKVDKNGYITV